jgi:hypothetical protein
MALKTTSIRDNVSLTEPGAAGGAGFGEGVAGLEGTGDALGETGLSSAHENSDTSNTAPPQRWSHRSAREHIGDNMGHLPAADLLIRLPASLRSQQ